VYQSHIFKKAYPAYPRVSTVVQSVYLGANTITSIAAVQ